MGSAPVYVSCRVQRPSVQSESSDCPESFYRLNRVSPLPHTGIALGLVLVALFVEYLCHTVPPASPSGPRPSPSPWFALLFAAPETLITSACAPDLHTHAHTHARPHTHTHTTQHNTTQRNTHTYTCVRAQDLKATTWRRGRRR